MNISEQITELSAKWYDYVGRDHHKDRDCHFYIEKKWSYGKPPVYFASHHGYIADDWHSPSYATAAEAEEALLKWLTHQVNAAKIYLKEEIQRYEQNEDYFSMGFSLSECREVLENLEK